MNPHASEHITVENERRVKDRRQLDNHTLQIMSEVHSAVESALERHEASERLVLSEIKDMIQDTKDMSEQRHRELGERFEAMQQTRKQGKSAAYKMICRKAMK